MASFQNNHMEKKKLRGPLENFLNHNIGVTKDNTKIKKAMRLCQAGVPRHVSLCQYNFSLLSC